MEQRKIRMLRTMDGSPNGIAVHRYDAETAYAVHPTPKLDPKHPHLSPELADVFVREGWATEEDVTGPTDDPGNDSGVAEGASSDENVQSDDAANAGAGDAGASQASAPGQLGRRRRGSR